MAPIRTSNLERGKWRSKCREQLSKHIQSRIGIAIEPSQVRLIPGANDPYNWKVLPEKKYLFSKNMSDHSISAYKELYGEIGVLFEAVPVKTTRAGTGSEDVAQEVFTSVEPPQISFSAKIDELRDEKLRVEQELKRWRAQAAAESELRHRSEHELNQLKATNQALQRELQQSTATADFFRDNTYQYIQVMNRIMELAEELKTRANLSEGLHEFAPLVGTQST